MPLSSKSTAISGHNLPAAPAISMRWLSDVFLATEGPQSSDWGFSSRRWRKITGFGFCSYADGGKNLSSISLRSCASSLLSPSSSDGPAKIAKKLVISSSVLQPLLATFRSSGKRSTARQAITSYYLGYRLTKQWSSTNTKADCIKQRLQDLERKTNSVRNLPK